MDNENLFAALRAGFPADALDDTAVEAIDTADDTHADTHAHMPADPAGASASATPRHYSWRDLDRGSAMLANLLASLELPAGARIAVQVPKSVEALMLYLAVLRAGFVYLPLNSAYRQAEMAYFIGDAEPAVVVCAPGDFGWLAPIAFKAGAKNVYTLDARRSGSLLQRAVHHADAHEPAHKAAGDLAAILYTSGTTGRSKGAMLSHGNLLSNALTLKSFWGWTGADVLIHALPIFHVHGLFVAIHGALLNGSPMLWFDRFDAAAVAARLPGATVFMGVPTLYVRLLAEAGLTRDACRHMRLFVSGSAPLLIETFDAFRARTAHTILERYGMSETVMLTSNPYLAEPGQREPARRGGTVGRALPGVDLRVMDYSASDACTACPAGAIGQVEVRGPNVFAGYWRMPEKTAEEFTTDAQEQGEGQRWFKTGDVGRLDADGVLTIVGRSKDLVITGGYNVYPAEVEAVLNELPGVAESAVIGVPHADFGEAVVAIVVPRPGAEPPRPAELIAAMKAQVANFKVPKQIVVAEDLPRNAMGKVQKNVLRERFGALLNG